MILLLAISLFIDIIIAYYCYRQAFIVRSNVSKSYRTRFAMMIAVIVGAVILQKRNLPLACIIAGIPAGLASMLVIGLAIVYTTHKGPWN
mgnify:CR=1 FL=1